MFVFRCIVDKVFVKVDFFEFGKLWIRVKWGCIFDL